MSVRIEKVTAKLPVAWNAKDGKVVSENGQELTITQIDTLQDALSHFKGEKGLVEEINGMLREKGIRAEYSARVAQVKPSDMTDNERDERAVNALVKTGQFTIDEARAVVASKRAA
jgi:NADH dehydrogenase FAD-containing subunit